MSEGIVKRITIEEAIKQLDEDPGGDPEGSHSNADAILLELVDPAVKEAVLRLKKRCGGFWYA